MFYIFKSISIHVASLFIYAAPRLPCLVASAPVGRGVYSGKSDCLFLLKNKLFYGKPAKNFMCLDGEVAKKPMKEQS